MISERGATKQGLILLGTGLSTQVWACATCGLSRSFTPKMLLISTGFVILPFCFVGAIAWKLWKDSKALEEQKKTTALDPHSRLPLT